MLSRRLALWSLGYGLLIWFEAALTIRFLGNYIFVPDRLMWMAIIFGGTAVLAFAIGWFFFQWFQTTPTQRAATTIVICAVGCERQPIFSSFLPNERPLVPFSIITQEMPFGPSTPVRTMHT